MNIAIFALLIGLGSSILLKGSEEFVTEGDDTLLEGWNYSFSNKELLNTWLIGGIAYISIFVMLSDYYFNQIISHPLPVVILMLLITQSMIDSKYYELADEWNFCIGVLTVFYVQFFMGGVTWNHFALSLFVFLFFAIQWFFFDRPGLGDAKMALAVAPLMNISGFILFMFVSHLGALVMTLIGAIKDGELKNYKTLKLPLGPYLAISYTLGLIGFFQLGPTFAEFWSHLVLFFQLVFGG